MVRTVVIPFALMMLAGGKGFALIATTTPTNVMNSLYDARLSGRFRSGNARFHVERLGDGKKRLTSAGKADNEWFYHGAIASVS